MVEPLLLLHPLLLLLLLLVATLAPFVIIAAVLLRALLVLWPFATRFSLRSLGGGNLGGDGRPERSLDMVMTLELPPVDEELPLFSEPISSTKTPSLERFSSIRGPKRRKSRSEAEIQSVHQMSPIKIETGLTYGQLRFQYI